MKHTIARTLIVLTIMAGPRLLAQDKKKPVKVPKVPQLDVKLSLTEKLRKFKISGFTIKKMTVEDAFKYLSAEYAKASGAGGINFLYKCNNQMKLKKISLDLSATSVPVSDVIYYVCMQAGLNHRIDDFAVVVWQLKAKERLNRF